MNFLSFISNWNALRYGIALKGYWSMLKLETDSMWLCDPTVNLLAEVLLTKK